MWSGCVFAVVEVVVALGEEDIVVLVVLAPSRVVVVDCSLVVVG